MRVLPAGLWPGHEPLFEVPDRRALLGAVQHGTLEFHPWNVRSRAFERPDRMVFDLDPGEDTAWPQVQEAARLVRALLGQLGLRSWLKTSGGRGLHLVVPLEARHRVTVVHGFAKAIGEHLARTLPERFVARAGVEHRVGRVFIDVGRNGEGATTVAPYALRARPGLGVSMPVDWDALTGVASGAHWTITDAAAHVAARGSDPWAELPGTRQPLGPAMRSFGYAAPA